MEYYIHLTWSIFIFITGLMFGSFFTLAIYRIPRRIDIVKSRSYCPNCKHKLGFFDCFPILSYVSTIGRCRYCKRPISIRYPLIELASGMAFLITYLIFGFSWQFFILIAAYVYAVLIVGIDVMRYKMTDEEKEQVEKMKEALSEKKENKKKASKVGALNSELLVAVAIFLMFFISTIFVVRNYYSNLSLYSKKTEALNICVNKINEAKQLSFSNVKAGNETIVRDGINYVCSTETSYYVKNGTEVNTNAMVVAVKVSFETNGKTENVSLKILKVK